MSPSQFLFYQLSGTIMGGFGLYVVILVSGWAIWSFTFFSSRVVSSLTYRRIGVIFTIAVIGFYTVQRVRHPPLLVPELLWVQPFQTSEQNEGNADCAKFALEKSLEQLNKKIVGFQTTDVGKELLKRKGPSDTTNGSSELSKGATLIDASFVAEGNYRETENQSYLTLKAWKIKWNGEIIGIHDVSAKGSSPASAGRNAAMKLSQIWKLSSKQITDNSLLSQEILTALFVADTLNSCESAIKVLSEAFTSPDSSEAVLWEAIADKYYRTYFPDMRDKTEYAVRKAIKLDTRSARAHYIHSKMLFSTGLERKTAIAGLKYSYRNNPRDPDPVCELLQLDSYEVIALRMGGREKILDYALRLRPSNPEARRLRYRYSRDNLLQKSVAQRLVDKGLLLNPHQPRLLMMKAVVAMHTSQFDSAEIVLNHLLEIKPNDPNALYNLGIVHRELMKDEEARDDFLKSIEHDGPRDAHYYLALYYLANNDTLNALNQLRWRWAKRTEVTKDFFARVSRERIRRIVTGKGASNMRLPEWRLGSSVDEDTSEASRIPEMIETE
ncbi:MAG: hypothetical protein P9L92_14080 [Candidatus Electryonea clarkiae]|nr:hypothetical protein [Candidatus Electryonea clarkiae]MDP8289057.1 hypothetical protein [Candidatus Electryonea clarkiae]